MNQVDDAKNRIEKLAEANRRMAKKLESSRRAAAGLRRDRVGLVGRLQDAEAELVAMTEQMQEIGQRTRLLLDQRQVLGSEAAEARALLDRAEDRIRELAVRLDRVTRERDVALAELDEATHALVDIRNQLEASLAVAEDRGEYEGVGAMWPPAVGGRP